MSCVDSIPGVFLGVPMHACVDLSCCVVYCLHSQMQTVSGLALVLMTAPHVTPCNGEADSDLALPPGNDG